MPTFIDKMRAGQVCLGTIITFNDPAVTEALCLAFDFVWIDTEHNPFTLETLLAHLLAAKGTDTTPIVRVPWNDPVLIKQVLDTGAPGVVVPFVRSAEEARRAVAACRYPPDGIRGYGPRRPSNYGRERGPAFMQAANDSVIVVCQIEHIDAVNDIDHILAVPGLTAITTGSNDLAASMGHAGEPNHPDIIRALEMVLAKARQAGIFAGVSVGHQPDMLVEWVKRGAQWLAMGADYGLLTHMADTTARQVREQIAGL